MVRTHWDDLAELSLAKPFRRNLTVAAAGDKQLFRRDGPANSCIFAPKQ